MVTTMKRSDPKRLVKVLEALAILHDLGDYDTTIVGAVGEIYAEVVFKMKKADRGQKGFDGTINGRTVSVKAKESDKKGRYVTVPLKHRELVDQLLVVVLKENGQFEHYGPVDICKIEHLINATNHRVMLDALSGVVSPTPSKRRWKP